MRTPIWVIPKVSVPVVKDKFNIGAGALVGYVVGLEKAGFRVTVALGKTKTR